ncbi:hypothetical protein TrRE_jg3862, partial [Triparma retinervis]
MGLNFMAYDVLMGYMGGEGMGKSSALLAGTVGALSGGVSKLSVYPMDTVKKRLQKHAFTSASVSFVRMSPLKCGMSIVRDEGAKALYRGLAPTVVKSMVGTGLTFAFYNATRTVLVEAGGEAGLG